MTNNVKQEELYQKLEAILLIDDNKLKHHERVGAGRCSCGFDAYRISGIMLDYGDLLRNHIEKARVNIKEYELQVKTAKKAILDIINQQVVKALQEARIKIVELDQMYEPNTIFDPAIGILDEAIKEYKGE